ncbi:hypothetical protein Nepgr_030311 [Nepenthes gracilis]|uniref:RNA methyltransferase n=1 Tax=Nepenthes gracilis TaxID=150966 RepID=A0AAD3Y430_NEPGR|nr:hypothetical protein Nepgr_030311 [Nepenthes gracilis]
MAKKKRFGLEGDPEQAHSEQSSEKQVNASELTNGEGSQKTKKKKKKRQKEEGVQRKFIPTVSIAVPGSIMDNAQSLELATRLAGQIARAATIFRVDEIVVFDNRCSMDETSIPTIGSLDANESGAAFLIGILQYLETPQYLRKSLFPKCNSLRFVGMLPPLDAPHHLRKHEWAPYREGVTLKEKAPNSLGALVDVGLSKNVVIGHVLEPGIRVTVAMGTNRNSSSDALHQVVSTTTPRDEEGIYWGYKVRYASNLSCVIDKCPYEGGYDYLIGTSEHGLKIKSSELSLPIFRHLLIAFGGLAGLEESIEEDKNLKGKNAGEVFNLYLNTCPNQGSRTIRTEEAILISLQYFQEPIHRAMQIT